ncbi:Uma2 family endonuclease [Aquabacterium sp. A7-Y]|uniref:Uma2 family endonuclease n=1 Tax=Aquabacterium sp. A7-Y TaxID=1349605 RepID=UPI00223E7E24|nr:Uma2 family endonuclease [Aquabacterium sp. A7-Y]MCW7537617.1 Uma2 family endonuclease [Aquabacterium sp. A7-Y]
MGLPLKKVSPAEYLAWEEEQPERYEYVDGEIFAMVGGWRRHHQIVVKPVRHLDEHLEDTPCEVASETMKLRIGGDAVFYPDILVTCDPKDLARQQYCESPFLIVEVLSPSTEAYDRTRKFELYRRIASLREYVLIDPETLRIEVFRLGNDGLWALHDQSGGPSLSLQSLDFELPLRQLFRRLKPPVFP